MIEFGASPRGPIGLVQAARVLALLRGRGHVEGDDIRDLAADVLRHRIVLSYDALSEGVTADELLERVLAAVPEPGTDAPHPQKRRPSRAVVTASRARSRRPPGRARVRSSQPLIEALDVAVSRLVARTLPGDRRAAGVGVGTELAQLRPYEIGDDVRHIDPPATARTGQPHVRLHVPERALTTWIVLDVSPSMAFGTAQRLKADVAEGVALVFGRLGVRRAGSVGLVAFGAAGPRVLPPRGSKPGIVALRRFLAEGVAPDGQHDADGLADALRRVARLARQPGLVVVISDFRDQHAWERPLGSLQRPPLGARGRDRRSARDRAARGSATWRWSIPRAARGSRSTPRAGACASDSPSSSASAARRWRASCAACGSSTCAVDRRGLAGGARTRAAMSFASPVWLAGLALIPVAIAVVDRRAPAREALRDPLPRGLDAPARGRRRRTVVAALPPGRPGAGRDRGARVRARPPAASATARPVRAASVVLVTDHSGSMAADDVKPTRLAAAERAANTFIDQLPAQARVGAVAFSIGAGRRAGADAQPRRGAGDHRRPESANGATATGDALQLALRCCTAARARQAPRRRRSCSLSDGAANAGISAITVARQAARREDPDLHGRAGHARRDAAQPRAVRAAARRSRPIPQLMREIAEVSHGRTFNAQSADRLSSIYKGLGDQTRQRDPQARDHRRVRDRRPGAAAAGRRVGDPLVGAASVARPYDATRCRAATSGSKSGRGAR